MACSQKEFLDWESAIFEQLFRKDPQRALSEANEKAQALQPADRKILAGTYANVAIKLRRVGSLLGGGKLALWAGCAAASVVVFEFGGGQWAALPLATVAVLAARDLCTSRATANAYSRLAEVLKDF